MLTKPRESKVTSMAADSKPPSESSVPNMYVPPSHSQVQLLPVWSPSPKVTSNTLSVLVASSSDSMRNAGLTAFSIGSGPLGLAPVNGVQGIASASVGVTDVLGGGAELAPDGAGMYRAFTNGSDTFTNLLGSSLVAGEFSSAQSDDNFGLAAIAGPVSQIAAEWNFTLTAFDTAAGTSTFSITPAPGAVSLLGFAGLVAARRRR